MPRDAYWSWGLYDSLIVVVPSLDLVVARAGSSWKRKDGSEHYDVLRPFLEPIAAAVTDRKEQPARPRDDSAAKPPYPQSSVITGVEWASVESIVRLAPGGDNWPMAWGKDDELYTAYGDGRGFKPFVARKLSLGLAQVSGMPPDIRGTNLSSPTIEQTGEGAAGARPAGC